MPLNIVGASDKVAFPPVVYNSCIKISVISLTSSSWISLSVYVKVSNLSHWLSDFGSTVLAER